VQKQISLKEKQVEYTLKISRRSRRLRLAIYNGGDFVVTAPAYLNIGTIESFISQKADWVIQKIEQLRTLPKPTTAKADRVEYSQMKPQALAFVTERVKYFNKLYGFKYGQIFIKNQKTVWGSCSRKGNLNFNYKIIKLPNQMADYLIVHELCHLQEFNHSPAFWHLVSKTIPDYVRIRKELKTNNLNIL
jgi:predicted metal-dependent hydrolase